MKTQIEDARNLASPPTLELTDIQNNIVENGHKITLQFTPSKNEPLGSIVFDVTIVADSETRVLDFWPSIEGGAFSSGPSSKKIQDDGRQARLQYSLVSVGRPTFDLTLSGEARIKVEGNYLKKAIILPPE